MSLSPIAAEHVQRPRHRGPLDESSLYGVAGSPGDGPYVEMWVKLDGGAIRDAAFRTPGCPSSTAAASMLCELAIGRDPQKILSLTPDDLLRVLGGLPEGKEMYATMSVNALADALRERD